MDEQERETMRRFLTTEVTRRFGAERAASLSRDIDALASDLAEVALAEVPDETEPAFFLHRKDA